MSVDTFNLRTKRGDDVTVSLFDFSGQEPTVCITVDDVDGCELPTVEFTMSELVDLREIFRKCGEILTLREVRRAG